MTEQHALVWERGQPVNRAETYPVGQRVLVNPTVHQY